MCYNKRKAIIIDQKTENEREEIKMCTAATYKTECFYMGRTLDYEFSYGERITITPRNYPFHFRHDGDLGSHYAMIGMAHIADGFPLYYDAVNEKGLGMAGLNFAKSAEYPDAGNGRCVAQFEFIPWILSQCADLSEARKLLGEVSVVGTQFSEKLPVAKMHWIIADKTGAIVVEPFAQGLRIHDNPAGVLTNEPPFEQQISRLSDYMHLSPKQPENKLGIPLEHYSRGMGALGLPGDLSSASRFVRAAFTRAYSVSGSSEEESVGQFFHILGSVEQVRGCCEVEPGKYEITIYTSCWNADRGIYYHTTYNNHQISAVDMHSADLDGSALYSCPLQDKEQIRSCGVTKL